MELEITPHGFRSSFKDWASERTHFPNEISEMALAHTIPNKTEAAYRRGDLLERRRELMAAWDRFATSSPKAKRRTVRTGKKNLGGSKRQS
jgi:integrase